MKATKRRGTIDQVLVHPEWARTLYLQGAHSPVEAERGRRHLTGAGLRHAVVDPDQDRYAWTKGRTVTDTLQRC